MRRSTNFKSFIILATGYFFAGSAADNNASSLVAASVGLTLMQDNAAQNQCYDAIQTVFPPKESAFSLWQAQWPPRAEKLIANEKCFCDSQIPAAEIKYTRQAIQWHTELAQYEMLHTQVLAQLQKAATLEALRKHMKSYCITQLKQFMNPKKRPHLLSFSPSKALDYSLSLLASHSLLDIVAPFFEYGMRNFNADLNDWLQVANNERYAAIYGFIQYLKNGRDFNAAMEALKQLDWIQAQDQLPLGFAIENCYVLAPNRHEFFAPMMSSPFTPWFGQLTPDAIQVLQMHQGAVCRQHFTHPTEYEKTVEWDLWQLEISIFERLYAASLELQRGNIDSARFNDITNEVNDFIELRHLPLRPTGALDYLIGQLSAHGHLNAKIQQLLLIGMENYGDLSEWQGFAQTQNWQQVQHLIGKPQTITTQSNGFFSQNQQTLPAIGIDKLARTHNAAG